MRDAVLIEFASPEQLAEAIRSARKAGYRRLDAHTPYPAEEVQKALELDRSRIPFACFVLGILGAAAAYGLQWLLEGELYPINVGGRPLNPPLMFMIITFEMGVLAAALTAFISVFYAGGLLRWWDLIDEVDGFASATDDRFWLVIPGRSAVGKRSAIERELAGYDPIRVVTLRSGRVS